MTKFKQKTLTYFGRGSITVWLTSCLTGYDLTKLVNLCLIQHKQSSRLLTSQTWGQSYNDTLTKNVSVLWFKATDVIAFCLKMALSWPIFLYFVFSIQLTVNVQYKFLPTIGFELRTSGIESDCSTNLATTTAPLLLFVKIGTLTRVNVRDPGEDMSSALRRSDLRCRDRRCSVSRDVRRRRRRRSESPRWILRRSESNDACRVTYCDAFCCGDLCDALARCKEQNKCLEIKTFKWQKLTTTSLNL